MPVAHPDLAAGLDLGTYSSKLYDSSSVQSCQAAGSKKARLGKFTSAPNNHHLSLDALACHAARIVMSQTARSQLHTWLEWCPVSVDLVRGQVQG